MAEYTKKELYVKQFIEHRYEQLVKASAETSASDLFYNIIGFRAASDANNQKGIEAFHNRLKESFYAAFKDSVTFSEIFTSAKREKWDDFVGRVSDGVFPAGYMCVEILAKRDLTDDYTITLENGRNSETLEICENNIRIKSNGDGKRIFTDKWHTYHFVLTHANSMVFVDGSLILSSDLLIPTESTSFKFEITRGCDPELLSRLIKFAGVYFSPEALKYTGSGYDLFQFQRDYAEALYKIKMHERSAEEFANLGFAPIEGMREKTWAAVEPLFFSAENPVNLSFVRQNKLKYLKPGAEAVHVIQRIKPLSDQPSVIEVKNLGMRFAKNPADLSRPSHILRRLIWGKERYDEEYSHWIFRDLNFELFHGEILGIIGPNGAGKSTLLRVLAGLVNFNEGEVTVRANPVLLQPGLGLRPLFSGYDNIFFSLVYYGYSRSDIKKVIDGIVEFSELGEAIYRPCLYYSSGMISRLTFSIATAIAPEALMLDELLGPGDVKFREKATARMLELIDRAKLVLVVSHNLGFVRNYCTKVLYLNEHKAKFIGNPHEAVDRYLNDTNPRHKVDDYGKSELESVFQEEL